MGKSNGGKEMMMRSCATKYNMTIDFNHPKSVFLITFFHQTHNNKHNIRQNDKIFSTALSIMTAANP